MKQETVRTLFIAFTRVKSKEVLVLFTLTILSPRAAAVLPHCIIYYVTGKIYT